MLRIDGYAVASVVHEGQRSAVYRGVRASDGLPVILKTPRAEFATADDFHRLRR